MALQCGILHAGEYDIEITDELSISGPAVAGA